MGELWQEKKGEETETNSHDYSRFLESCEGIVGRLTQSDFQYFVFCLQLHQMFSEGLILL